MRDAGRSEASRQRRGAMLARLLGAVGAGMLLAGCGPDQVVTMCRSYNGGICPTAEAFESTLEDEGYDEGCTTLDGVESGPTINEDGACCYEVGIDDCDSDDDAVEGRPLFLGGGAVTANTTERSGWHGADAVGEAASLDAAARATLAQAWSKSALAEHASVASFARAALELMAVGAPADLVTDAHRAALDEIRHAELCFALAGRYAGAAMGPTSLPLGDRLELRSDLVALAEATVIEGCVNETLAALEAGEQLARCGDPEVAAALRIIVEDETRHAELAWRTVAWAMQVGGEPVVAAVRAAFARATRVESSGAADAASGAADAASDLPVRRALLEAHGCLDKALVRAHAARALREVVGPCAARLLSTYTPGSTPRRRYSANV